MTNNVSGDPRGDVAAANLTAAGDIAESETARVVGRVRLMMIVSGLTTVLAIGAVVTVIGYRMFSGAGSGPMVDAIAMLPKNARVVSMAAVNDRIALLLDIGGTSELRTFDVKTLKPVGRLHFATEP